MCPGIVRFYVPYWCVKQRRENKGQHPTELFTDAHCIHSSDGNPKKSHTLPAGPDNAIVQRAHLAPARWNCLLPSKGLPALFISCDHVKFYAHIQCGGFFSICGEYRRSINPSCCFLKIKPSGLFRDATWITVRIFFSYIKIGYYFQMLSLDEATDNDRTRHGILSR